MSATDSIQLTLSHHETTNGMAFQVITIELVSRDRLTTPQALSSLALPSGIDPRKGVVISGRAPQWVVAYLIHECHPTLWVACFDPRLGAVVVATHSPQVRVGQVIGFEILGLLPELRTLTPRNLQTLTMSNPPGKALSTRTTNAERSPSLDRLGKALLVVGPPDSGKSVLSHQLFNTLVKEHPDIYLQRAQWDGEGNWILELPKTATDEADESVIEAFKQANKGALTPGFFPYQGEAILNLRRQKKLVIVDVGGMVQPEKKSILEACTHYLIISAKPEAITSWHEFCSGEGGLAPVAVVHSVLEKKLEILQREPFLEIVCGPWVMCKTKGVPEVLRAAIEQVCMWQGC